MLRKIIYGILGFISGSAISLLIFAKYVVASTSSDLIFLLLILIFGVPGLFLGIKLAARKNIKEQQYSKANNESMRGYLYIIGSILGVQFLIKMVISLLVVVIGYIVSWHFNLDFQGFAAIFKNKLVITIIGILLNITLSWIGVWYVLRKDLLKQFYSPFKISLLVTVVSAVFSYQQVMQIPLSSSLSLIAGFYSLFYFLDRAVKRLAYNVHKNLN